MGNYFHYNYFLVCGSCFGGLPFPGSSIRELPFRGSCFGGLPFCGSHFGDLFMDEVLVVYLSLGHFCGSCFGD